VLKCQVQSLRVTLSWIVPDGPENYFEMSERSLVSRYLVRLEMLGGVRPSTPGPAKNRHRLLQETFGVFTPAAGSFIPHGILPSTPDPLISRGGRGAPSSGSRGNGGGATQVLCFPPAAGSTSSEDSRPPRAEGGTPGDLARGAMELPCDPPSIGRPAAVD
jgi:hypothetical protein